MIIRLSQHEEDGLAGTHKMSGEMGVKVLLREKEKDMNRNSNHKQ
jgi:hypothetical protein